MEILNASGVRSYVTLPLPPLQKWTRITLVYDAVAGLTVIEDGTTIGTSNKVTGAPGTIEIIVGAPFANPMSGASPLTLEIDDVVLRGQ
jgi:hypothetical protein